MLDIPCQSTERTNKRQTKIQSTARVVGIDVIEHDYLTRRKTLSEKSQSQS